MRKYLVSILIAAALGGCAHLSPAGTKGPLISIHTTNPEFFGGRVALLVGDSLQAEGVLGQRSLRLRFRLDPSQGYLIIAQQEAPINTDHYTFRVWVTPSGEAAAVLVELAQAQPCGKPVLIIRKERASGSVRVYSEEDGRCESSR
jgi:hypothetical protein